MHIYTYMSCFDKFITWWMKTWNHSISVTERLLIQNFLVNVGVIPDFCTSCKTRLDIFILQPTYRQTSLQKLSLYLQGASWGRSWCPCLSWLGSLWGLSSKKGSLYNSGKTIIAVSQGRFVMGDLGKCSWSPRVCERSTHTQREDKTLSEGPEKNPGGLQLPGLAKQGWIGMDFKRPKAKSERWELWMVLETAEFFHSYRKG